MSDNKIPPWEDPNNFAQSFSLFERDKQFQEKLLRERMEAHERDRLMKEAQQYQYIPEPKSNYFKQNLPNFREEMRKQGFSKQTPKFTKTPIPAVPSTLCVQYIGGPLNGEQKFLEAKDHPEYRQGVVVRVGMFEPIKAYNDPNEGPIAIETYNYKLTFIPPSETQFSDAQIVIALFQ